LCCLLQFVKVSKPHHQATITQLRPGTEYQVRVYSTRGPKQSSPSEATFITEVKSM